MQSIDRKDTAVEDLQRFDPQDIFQAGLLNHHIANTAYPIAHVLTMKPYRIGNSFKNEFTKNVWNHIDSLGLYAHVPFCEHICTFCEYTVVNPKQFHNGDIHKIYFDAIEKEFAMYATQTNLGRKKLEGFDIGGGTPSAVDTKYIEKLINLAQIHFAIPENMGISIETTPKIAATNPEKIKAYHDMGINRISMGVQDINPKILESVGRMSTGEKWNIDATKHIRDAGFNSFNIDIMYGLPQQNIERVKATLTHVLSLDPEHITLYRTRYKGTRLQEKGFLIELQNIQDQYDTIKAILKEAGYYADIGKNTFSKIPGNSGASEYLTKRVVNGTPYLGVGLGSQSYNINSLSYNQGAGAKNIQNYLRYINEKQEFPIQDIYHLSKEMSAGKFLAVSFYFGGIDLASFTHHFQCRLEDMFKEEVSFVIQNGYMKYENGRLQLTEHGNKYYNGVIALFYAGSVKKVLLDKI